MIGAEQAVGEDSWRAELLRTAGPLLKVPGCQPWELELDAVGDLEQESYVGKRHK